jgi:hypothetical protein
MAILTMRFGIDTMTDDTKDKFIAPKISALKAPALPDITAERRYLLATFILNFDLSLIMSNKHRQLIFNVVRKAEDAFNEYCQGADSLRQYITAASFTLSHYFSALRHFEHCLAHLYEAVCCLNAVSKTWGGPRQFDRGDGSILQRAHLIHTGIKHMDAQFEEGEFANETSSRLFATRSAGTRCLANMDASDIANVPMWLTDDGLECATTSERTVNSLKKFASCATKRKNWRRSCPDEDKQE